MQRENSYHERPGPTAPADAAPDARQARGVWGLFASIVTFMIILSLTLCDGPYVLGKQPNDASIPETPTREYQTIRSSGGILKTALTAASGPITIGGKTFPSTVYNGDYLAPVLRLEPGDSLKLHLINHLPKRGAMTNLHYHGTVVSPRAPSDDIFLHVMKQESYDYRVYFPPVHDRGLFWYYPHPHGQSEDQVFGGMAGVLVVDGFLEQFYPWFTDVKEEILMLKALELPGAKNGEAHTKNINGQLDATFRIRPGEIQFWRLANLAADAYFNLEIDGHRVWLLASDANALRRPLQVDSLFLPPGARMEVLVQGGPAGRYAIRQKRVDTGPAGDPNPAVRLGTLISEGTPLDRSAVVARLAGMSEIPQVREEIESLRKTPITRRRTFVFSETADGDTFFVNGRQFDPNRVDTQVNVGDVEEWTIENTSGEVHDSSYPVRILDPPTSLPAGDVRFDAFTLFTRASGASNTLTSVLGGGVGITNNLEVGGQIIPFRMEPGIAYTNPSLYATYIVNVGKVSLAPTLQSVLPLSSGDPFFIDVGGVAYVNIGQWGYVGFAPTLSLNVRQEEAGSSLSLPVTVLRQAWEQLSFQVSSGVTESCSDPGLAFRRDRAGLGILATPQIGDA